MPIVLLRLKKAYTSPPLEVAIAAKSTAVSAVPRSDEECVRLLQGSMADRAVWER